MKKKRKNKIQPKFIKVIIYLILLIILFSIAPNYAKSDDYYVQNKINLIIDNYNVTQNLKNDLFINDKGVIYISIEDVESYLDDSVIYDEQNNQIITTFGEKEVKLPLNENIIKVNNKEQDVLSGAIKKDETYYIPITAMNKIYEMDIEYRENEKILLLDSRTKKLIKADVSKSCNVKLKQTKFSKTVDKVKKAEKVIVIENLENNWTKIRTKNGKIGFVKTNILQNEVRVREDINEKMIDFSH